MTEEKIILCVEAPIFSLVPEIWQYILVDHWACLRTHTHTYMHLVAFKPIPIDSHRILTTALKLNCMKYSFHLAD